MIAKYRLILGMSCWQHGPLPTSPVSYLPNDAPIWAYWQAKDDDTGCTLCWGLLRFVEVFGWWPVGLAEPCHVTTLTCVQLVRQLELTGHCHVEQLLWTTFFVSFLAYAIIQDTVWNGGLWSWRRHSAFARQ